MIHTNKKFSSEVEAKVQEIEESTDAEIVVVASERSGSYFDLAMFGSTVLTVIMMTFAFPDGVVFSPGALAMPLALFWWIFAWILNRRWFIRLVSFKTRRETQVKDAAAKEFHRERVHSTPNRTGLLVYVSALEGEVILIPDSGLQEKIPDGCWSAAKKEFCHSNLDHFLTGLTLVGEQLSRSIPKLEHDDIDLPNKPRIRS